MEHTASGTAKGQNASTLLTRSCRRRPRPSRQCQICRASGKQQKSLIEPAAATKVRVERQTHLPASREEAWGVLKQLAPEHAWRELSPVLAALESIYRAEMQIAGEETLQALRNANDTLVELSSETPPSSRRNKRKQEAEAAGRKDPPLPGTPLEGQSKKKERTSKTSAEGEGSNGKAPDAEQERRDGFDQIPTDPAGMEEVEDAYKEDKQRGLSETVSIVDKQSAERGIQEAQHAKSGEDGSDSSSSNGNGNGSSSKDKAGVQLPDARAAGRVAFNVAQNVTEKARDRLEGAQEDAQRALSLAVGIEDGPNEDMDSAEGEREQDDHARRMAEVADPEDGLRVESASRLDWDRDRWLRRPLDAAVNPVKADSDFMAKLTFLLRKACFSQLNEIDKAMSQSLTSDYLDQLLLKADTSGLIKIMQGCLAAHFSQLNDRDEAMSRSLNSDYLDQLLIKADTSGLDGDLVRLAAEERPVPEEQQALLVFKRGYGQARRKGRMLVAKLDYLQLIVIKGSLAGAGKKAQQLWHAVRARVNPPEAISSEDSGSDAENVQEEQTAGEKVQGAWKKAGDKLTEWGILSPRLMLAGGGLFMTLSNWGLLPAVDVLPLERFNAVWRPNEPDRLKPVYVERVTIREALKGDLIPSLFGIVQLIEPTFGEVLVLYRRKSNPGWLKRFKKKVFGEEEGPRLMRREPIMLRVLRDIPVPSWKLVLPDKLLQFRPLDGLRADLVTVAGLAAFVAQAKYDSPILEIITIISATSLLSRVVLGYWRLAQRNEKLAIQVLAESTLAAQEAVIQYLAAAAGLQQWGQASLAFLTLQKSEHGLSTHQLSEAIESTLEDSFRVRVRFDVKEALRELTRLELVERVGSEEENGNGGSLYACVKSEDAIQHLEDTWRSILQGRLQSAETPSN